MKKLSFCFLLCVYPTVCGFGQTLTPMKPIEVSVRALTQVVVGPILHLRGTVEIEMDNVLIHADEADYNVTTGELEARGNVRTAKVGLAIADSPLADKFQTNTNTPKQCMFVFHKQGHQE